MSELQRYWARRQLGVVVVGEVVVFVGGLESLES
jgi:hypothetical protein|tara:strand:- start:453 stop:554 length:102 start_codon:yes stop_codon:yes gene_type:complete